MTQRIALAMIVRNEAANIEKCLRSAAPFCHDFVIVDTGSTDDTVAIAERALAGKPRALPSRKWVGFSHNRNEALDIARRRGSDYILTLDADEELVAPTGATLPLLDADCYAIPLTMGDQTWLRRVLLKASVPWRYDGAIHETVVCEGASDAVIVEGIGIRNRRVGETAADRVRKGKLYAAILRKIVRKNPRDARSWYYLAQALSAAQDIRGAMAAYRRRIALADGFPEEVFHAHYQLACLLEFAGHHVDDVITQYQRAYECRPTRAEPLWAIAVLLNDSGRPALAEMYARKACQLTRPNDALPVYDSVYSWRAADELAGALGRLGRHREAAAILERLVVHPQLPADERPRVAANIAMLEQQAA